MSIRPSPSNLLSIVHGSIAAIVRDQSHVEFVGMVTRGT